VFRHTLDVLDVPGEEVVFLDDIGLYGPAFSQSPTFIESTVVPIAISRPRSISESKQYVSGNAAVSSQTPWG
jgi:hypothetical protein